MTGPYTSNNAPETSLEAAEKVAPKVPTYRQQVLNFALRCGGADELGGGFIDEEMRELAPDERTFDRTFRPRRTELTDENWIVDSGFRRANRNGNPCVVWIHRDFAPNPPEVGKPRRGSPAKLHAEAMQRIADLEAAARDFRKEGRALFADMLLDTIRIMRELLA